MARQVFRVLPDAPDEGRSASRQPGQPQEVQPRHLRNTLLMHRSTLVIERIDLQPAEIEGVARRPHDGGYAGVREIHPADRIDDAGGIRRSEERRVGKECRAGWWACQYKQKRRRRAWYG